MDCGANRDLLFLQDEKFDFDVSLSPASSKGDDDEDEVFVGPISHSERCVASKIESEQEECGTWVSWSPLTGDQLEAVCQEAHRLAGQLQTGEPHGEHTDTTTGREEFVQDAEAKLSMLGKTVSVLSPIKRQTFCVQDSPLKQLPPTIQRQMLRGSSSSTALSTHPTARLSTSSPLVRAKTQPRTALRGKASLGVAIVLPSKPVAPPTSCLVNKSKMERTRLQPPSKVAGVLRRSPSSRRTQSSEDLLSDSASVASDVSDSSTNSSLLGKRTLAPPTKQSVRARNLSSVKALPPQSRRMTDRRNTSSSSSSVSSFNSSLSLSPAKGKLNSSLNRNLSTGPAPSSVSRPAIQSRARRSTVYNAAEPVSSGVSRRSLSTQVKKLSEAERVGAIKSTPVKRAQTTPLQPTPSKRLLERTASLSTTTSGRLQSGMKSKPRAEALVLPTPRSAGKGVCPVDDGSKVLKPKRLMEASSLDSLPPKLSAGPLTPSVGGCKPLLAAPRRPSALPTPAKRRASAIPAPSSQTRTVRSPAPTNTTPISTSAGRVHGYSPVPRGTQEELPIDLPEIQPFCLEEEEELGTTLPSKTQEPIQTENMDLRAPTETDSAQARSLIRLEPAEESQRKPQEVLLLDLSPPNLQPQEKLLIDLTNTPELTQAKNKSCAATQLIDLSSPLIKWSPEEKKENTVPLINLSF